MEISKGQEEYTKKFLNLFKRDGANEQLRALLIFDISQTPFEATLVEVNEERPATTLPKIVKCHSSPTLTLSEFFEECKRMYPSTQESVVIALPREYHSLKLSFPFKDPERVEKLLPQELEELCPYDPSDFIAGFAMTTNGTELSSSVHVSLMAKSTISEILMSAQKSGFDPVSIIPPTLGARPLTISSHGYESVLFSAGSLCGVSVLKDGVCLYDNICKREELSRTIAQVEHLFDIERFLLVGVSPDDVSSLKDHKTESLSSILSPRAFLALNASASSLQSIQLKRSEVNFRKDEFKVSYNFAEFFSEILKFKRKILMCLSICTLCIVLITASYIIHLAQEEKQLRTAVSQAIPEALQSSEPPLLLLKNKTQNLEQQLKDLGSPFSLSPIEALEIISKDLPAPTEIEVKNITIKGKSISLQGMSSGYAPVERLKRDLEKKKRVYCSEAKTQLKGSSGITRSGESKNEFSLEVLLCD